MEDTKNLQTDKKNKDYKINTNKSLQYPSCYYNSSVMECANGIRGRKLTIKEHDNLMPSRVLKIALVDATCSMTVSHLTYKFSLITYPVK